MYLVLYVTENWIINLCRNRAGLETGRCHSWQSETHNLRRGWHHVQRVFVRLRTHAGGHRTDGSHPRIEAPNPVGIIRI